MELEQRRGEFEKRGLRVAALMYDAPEVVRGFAERKGIRYPMLSDPESEVIRAFGILNTNIEKDSKAYGIPFPGTYIIDENGVVRAKFFEEDHRERFTAASILVRYFRDEAGGAVKTIETKHLKLTVSASDATVHPGSRVTLVLKVELKPKMHVYAPGVADDYIPVAWKMAESRAWVALPPEYPKPRTLHLEAIGETVPVFEGEFTVTRDVVFGQKKELAPAVRDGEIVVEGAFRYQACDDKMCYPPKTLPLEWRFTVRDLEQ